MSVKNGASRVLASIDSIKKQTIENWEFIICDDGSTDDTLCLLEKCASEDNRFIIIKNNQSMGLAYSLNRCLSCASGDFIARMDDDDFSYPDRFEKQIAFLNNNQDISFVSSNIDIFDGEKIIGYRKLKKFPKKKDFVMNSPFVHPATVFKTNDLKSVNGYRVCKDTMRGQDYDLFMRMYSKGFRGANLQEPVFRYTESKASFKKHTLKARVGEFKIRCFGFSKMHIIWWAFPFVFKPFIAHFIQLFRLLRKK